ncbi:MAG: cytochrome b N-terminal domain-containing protein [Acidobacteriota bacterium]
MFDRILQWLDTRIALPSALRTRFVAPTQENRWLSAIAVVILFLVLLQIITGFVLSCYYVPSSPHAHTSLLYLIKEVPAGALLHAVHHYTANALVILAALHLLLLFYHADYRVRRELVWLASLLLFVLILAACFTGQLLPWDQRGYYGMRVGASILADLPLIGGLLSRLFIGDIEISTLTLSRSFAVHVLAIPALLLALLRLRATAIAKLPQTEHREGETYYPNQFAREVFTTALVFTTILLSAYIWGAPLEPVADPSNTDYIARPVWYFLPLFQLLKLFPAGFEGIGSLIVLLVMFGLLTSLPFIDNGSSLRFSTRKIPTGIVATLSIGILMLILIAVLADRNPEISAQLARQRELTRELNVAPFRPVPVGRATPAPVVESSITAVIDQPPVVKAFIGLCAPCHGPQATGGTLGPSLIGLAAKRNYTAKELVQLLAQPTNHGLSEAMPAFRQLSKDQREQLASWLVTLDSPQQLATAAKVLKPPPFLFVQNCAGCHGPQGEGGFGPRLVGVGQRRSREAMIKLMVDPASAGLNNIMPPFDELSEEERSEIADWLITLQ